MVRDTQGQPLFSIGMFEDISERKATEKVRDSIFKISQATISLPTLDDLYKEIHAILNELMPVENFYIALYDPEDGLIHFPFFVDQFEKNALPVAPGHGVTAYLLRTGKPLRLTRNDFEKLLAQGELELIGSKSNDWLGVPLISNGQTIGAMVTQSYSPEIHFTDQQVDLLTFVSNQVAQAIEHHQAEEINRINEARYRNLFEDSPVSLWEENFSEVKEILDILKQKGIVDFQTYFENHPEKVVECISKIKVIDVNKAALNLVRAGSKEELMSKIDQIFSRTAQKDFIQEFVNVAAGMREFEWEGFNNTLEGNLITVNMHWTVALGYEETLSKVIVSVIDITDRKRAEENLDHRSRSEELLTQISTRFINLSTNELDSEINKALSLIGNFENVDRSYVFRVDPVNKTMTNSHEWCKPGVESEINSIRNTPLSSMPWLFQNIVEQPLIINCIANLPDEANLERKIFDSQSIQSLAIFPMQVNQKLIGFVGFDAVQSEREWQQDSTALMQQFANILSNAIERSRLIGELEERAIHDELTGVLNRRGFSEFAKIEINRAHRYGRPIGLIIVDMDHFKLVNDTLGHAAGDIAIKKIAYCCQKNIREIDLIGRWGGDEFVILLPETDQPSTIFVAERLRKFTENYSFKLEGKELNFTISEGVAVADKVKTSFDELFRQADSALYSAKQSGRNCVISYAEPNKDYSSG
jgi:diguanylate cyclase (GGDEF)-like protein